MTHASLNSAADLQRLLDDGSLLKMLVARRFDAEALRVYRAGEMPGLVHSYSGQEAVAVGVIGALGHQDQVSSHHRGHAHAIALNVDPGRIMAELYARAEGLNGGLGGSMHLASIEHGLIGANGIVGGGVGLAVGAALAMRARGTNGIAVAFFGDGVVNTGVLAETMNLAAVWSLPVLFVCEDNAYGEYTHRDRVTAGGISTRLSAYGVPCATVDGMDLVAVRSAADGMVGAIRLGEGPRILHAECYRFDGHHVAELSPGYRSQEEVARWRALDPIDAFTSACVATGVLTPADVARLTEDASVTVEDALTFARAGRAPTWEDLSSMAATYPAFEARR